MDEIERLLRQWVGADVMAAEFDIGVSLTSLDEAWVDVVTSTDPEGPTRSAIQTATAPLPPRTSRQYLAVETG